jgi:gliding motility-associated-like protein
MTLTITRLQDVDWYIETPRVPFCEDAGGIIRAIGLPANAQLLWNTGEQTRRIEVFTEGWYWAEYVGVCGPVRDSIYMYSENCGPRLFVPNAFAPTGNRRNEAFVIQGIGIKTFEIRIFNRWGEQLYFSNDIFRSWDGTHNGSPVPMGSYVYLIRVTGHDTPKVIEERGTVNVIR